MKKIGITLIVLGVFAITAFDVREGIEKDTLSNTSQTAVAFETYGPVVVLELFTSQGCSSCPSADVLLEKVKKEFQKEVIALSYHVDYWNYIGWKDPYSKSSYTQKQREYNLKLRNKSNYTPQLVVNGREHFVGSSKAKMYEAITKYMGKETTNAIQITTVDVSDKGLQFSYSIAGDSLNKKLRAILVVDERTTSVRRGENRNRVLRNSNIVFAEELLTIDSETKPIHIKLPESIKPTEQISLILIVEDGNQNITAAAKHSIKRS